MGEHRVAWFTPRSDPSFAIFATATPCAPKVSSCRDEFVAQICQLEAPLQPHVGYRGTSLMRNRHPPPKDHRRALGIALRYGAGMRWFLMSEVPLYLRHGRPLLVQHGRLVRNVCAFFVFFRTLEPELRDATCAPASTYYSSCRDGFVVQIRQLDPPPPLRPQLRHFRHGLRGQLMPSSRPWQMIRYFHSTVRNSS